MAYFEISILVQGVKWVIFFVQLNLPAYDHISIIILQHLHYLFIFLLRIFIF